jgi:hypothetical protein
VSTWHKCPDSRDLVISFHEVVNLILNQPPHAILPLNAKKEFRDG